ncbi:MAG TPA: DUF4865 family protein [Noviherbaspirillum sp.]|nr:DUF4865 family protein [Noviherbaspirillum sp.]
MIAMQYGFVLPADYDMTIIDRRIAEKGRFTDGLPGLVFKAYLKSRRTAAPEPDGENRYAPFYLWDSAAGMNDFLSGPGFVALTRSFGWPSVKAWSVWEARVSARVAQARFASRELIAVRPYAKLDELRAGEVGQARQAVERQHALAAVAGFEPTTWSIVRFALWEQLPPSEPAAERCVYEVGHVSISPAL